MTTVSNTSAAATSTTTSAANTSRSTLSGNFQTFLKLLTTQLQNQDPTSPMDTNQFTNQLVMYSQVEQQIGTNDKLDNLISLGKGQGVNAALGYLGWEVSSESNNLPKQNGEGHYHIDLANTAKSITVGISDSSGKTIRGMTLSPADQKSLDVVWDGKDNNGKAVADGAYKISVVAVDSAGATVKSTVSTSGTVTAITVDSSGNNVLKLGDVTVAPDKVKAVTAPTRTATGTNTSTTA